LGIAVKVEDAGKSGKARAGGLGGGKPPRRELCEAGVPDRYNVFDEPIFCDRGLRLVIATTPYMDGRNERNGKK